MKNRDENTFDQSQISKMSTQNVTLKQTLPSKTLKNILDMFSTSKFNLEQSRMLSTLQRKCHQTTHISQFLSTRYNIKSKVVENKVKNREYQKTTGFTTDSKMKIELFEKIGEGGFGKVYRGKEVLSQRQVAVKYSLCSPGVTPRKWLSQEIEISKKISELRIPGLLRILSCRVVRIDNEQYLETVMELGVSSLKEILIERQAQKRPFTEKELIKMLKSMSQTLSDLAKEGINHRDVSLHNFVLCQDRSSYKLIDFGHSHVFSLEKFDGVIGKWMYMAPELKDLIFKNRQRHSTNKTPEANTLQSIFERNSSVLMQTQIKDPDLVSLDYSIT